MSINIWLIKHKGANHWGNYMHNYELTIDNKPLYAQLCFYRRKDAQAYLKTLSYPEFYEVIKFNSQFKTGDNRKAK